jgi:hypothetical protein
MALSALTPFFAYLQDNGPIHYSVRFEDDNDEIKTVLKQHVLQIPKGKT